MSLRMPAEWMPHEAVWIGFPSDPALWLEDLEPAQAEVAAFARAVHADGGGERVILVAATGHAADAARGLAGDAAEVIVQHFGDIWLRDTGPIIVIEGTGRQGRDFGFNGWGGKYDLPGDDTIGDRLAESFGLPVSEEPWIFEGGALDVDGAGLGVTTEQCLLNPNRNPGMAREEIEARLRGALGVERLLWLGDGLLNDHTDGHVDNLARFIAAGLLAVPEAAGPDDPNAAVYADAAARAHGFGLEVVRLPSPGRVERDGGAIPASYMNFYIGNAAVVVPQYGAPNDQAAVAAIQALFPDRVATGFRADHILTGGGSFHCISQQIPRV
ncbi:agmatine deiminase family protein [Sphingomonas gilva]|uniref:Agmatine deiminase family protein n=1 Tax=Sphingomonas gilva TaxID=2305907 RepID=A0A396RMH6_9SPHN|nr:agmatine deiminase family protein [Sphingomonas gilva]RHW17600.1 agmatine deiminase family protein [Sphingomonas gilva]